MRHIVSTLILLLLCSCAADNPSQALGADLAGQGSLALAARYGAPVSYKRQGEYLQLNYGSAAAGCRLIVLVNQAQRVVGWVSAGKACAAP